MNKKSDTTATKCSAEQFRQVKSVIKHLTGDALEAKLEELFESGVPANGYTETRGGTAFTYLSLAFQAYNEDALAYLIRRNYEGLVDFGWTFTNYLWSEKATRALLDVGHSFADEITDPKAEFWRRAGHLDQEFYKTIAARGAKLDIPIVVNEVPIPPIVYFATYSSGTRLVDALLSVGIPVDVRQPGGYSVLHGAVMQGKTAHSKDLDSESNANHLMKVARAVLAAGGDVDMVDDEGRSALHLACKLGYLNKARVLIEAGADHLLRDKNGHTAQDLAKSAKRRDIEHMFGAMRARSTIMNVVAAAGSSAAP